MKPTSSAPPLVLLTLVLGVTATEAGAAIVPGQGTWETTLKARDLDGDSAADAYYDTALNITWLANNALEQNSSTYGGVSMHFTQTASWVNDLHINGIRGWRLPQVREDLPAVSYAGFPTDPSSSELAHLYYLTLGNQPLCDYSTAGCNFGPLDSQPLSIKSYPAFTQTPVPGRPGHVWTFSMYAGVEGNDNTSSGVYLGHIAIHDGDVGVPLVGAVPEPQTSMLVLAGVISLGMCLRRTRSRLSEGRLSHRVRSDAPNRPNLPLKPVPCYLTSQAQASALARLA